MIRLAVALGFLMAASAAMADPQAAAQLRDRALGDGTAWNILESLTTEVGPRPAGSPAAARACDWGDDIFCLQLPAGAWALPDVAPPESVLAPLRIIASPVPVTDAGSDVDDIAGAGVPVFLLYQDASHYFDYHHSADDTLAIVDPERLKRNVAAWAATLDVLADSAADFRKVKK